METLDFSRYAADAPMFAPAPRQGGGATVDYGVQGGVVNRCCGYMATRETTGYGGGQIPHVGVDVFAPAGAVVSALADCYVLASGNRQDYGGYVLVRYTVKSINRNISILDGHLSPRGLVPAKTVVKKGTPLGRVGNDAENGRGSVGGKNTHVHKQAWRRADYHAPDVGDNKNTMDPAEAVRLIGGGVEAPRPNEGELIPGGIPGVGDNIAQGVGLGIANGIMWAAKEIAAHTVLRPLDYAGGFTYEFIQNVLADFDPGGLYHSYRAARGTPPPARDAMLGDVRDHRRRTLAVISLAVLTYHIPFARDESGAVAVESQLTRVQGAAAERIEAVRESRQERRKDKQPRSATLTVTEKGRAVVNTAANRKKVTRKSARGAGAQAKSAVGRQARSTAQAAA